MAVPLAPPLRSGVGARGDRDRVARRRRRREVLGRVAIGRDRHRRAAVGADAVDVEHAGDLVAARLRSSTDLPSADHPRHQLVRIVERQPRELAAGEREDVDVAVAGARRGEREPLAVGREQRPRFGRRMRHEQPRVAAARRHFPDVAAADERDRRAVGRDARLGERGQRRAPVARRLRFAGLKPCATTMRDEQRARSIINSFFITALSPEPQPLVPTSDPCSSCRTPKRRACPCRDTARRAPSSRASARP